MICNQKNKWIDLLPGKYKITNKEGRQGAVLGRELYIYSVQCVSYLNQHHLNQTNKYIYAVEEISTRPLNHSIQNFCIWNMVWLVYKTLLIQSKIKYFAQIFQQE